MGNRISERSAHPAIEVAAPQGPPRGERRKRLAEEMLGELEAENVTPRRKRVQSTSDYIYDTLFNKGSDSDITIRALGKEWKLHKLYLRQSGYFSSMFSGSWKESNESCVTLDIPDLNITKEALNIALSSLYRDEFPLDETHMCSIVAAASMLQLDGLLEHCKLYMRENLNPDSIVGYITASSMYGLTDLEKECKDWLLLHLLKRYTTTLLKDMRSQLLAEILHSPDLYVMQIEMDVYTLAKKWLFLVHHPEWSGEPDKLLADAEEYFRARGQKEAECFLSQSDNEEYVKVFKEIRLQHILNDKPSLTTIEADKIIPDSWLFDLYRKQWLKMLSVEQRLDPGPSGQTEEQFNRVSVRCGRVIYEPGDYCWRWTGYSFGFDTLVTYCSNTGAVAIKRNTKMQPCASAVSMQPKRAIAIRLRAVSFDGQEVFSCLNSGILHLNLSPDEEYPLLKNVPNSHFPIYISVNFSLISA